MRMFVDAWDPSYGASFSGDGGGDGPSASSSAKVEIDHEVAGAEWAPVDANPDACCPDVVLLVDGVQRRDALLWTEEEDGSSHPGLAASFAAGVVRCDLRNGVADLLPGATVGRALFTASPSAEDLVAGSVRYQVRRIFGTGEVAKLQGAVQAPLTELEVEISRAARASEDDLLVVDGPLRGRKLPHLMGYVKTQQSQYLPAAQHAMVPRLAAGQRTPIFRNLGQWGFWSWYLRLPGKRGAPWAGIVRVEVSPELTAAQAIEMADLSVATLPRFASSSYKDARAPQNLVPIAGLERRLRGMLGDARVLHRALTLATVRTH